jgi:hypothetical protein
MTTGPYTREFMVDNATVVALAAATAAAVPVACMVYLTDMYFPTAPLPTIAVATAALLPVPVAYLARYIEKKLHSTGGGEELTDDEVRMERALDAYPSDAWIESETVAGKTIYKIHDSGLEGPEPTAYFVEEDAVEWAETILDRVDDDAALEVQA